MKAAGTGKDIPWMVLDSSMVEHSAVNRVVVGSSPTRGGIMLLTGFSL